MCVSVCEISIQFSRGVFTVHVSLGLATFTRFDHATTSIAEDGTSIG